MELFGKITSKFDKQRWFAVRNTPFSSTFLDFLRACEEPPKHEQSLVCRQHEHSKSRNNSGITNKDFWCFHNGMKRQSRMQQMSFSINHGSRMYFNTTLFAKQVFHFEIIRCLLSFCKCWHTFQQQSLLEQLQGCLSCCWICHPQIHDHQIENVWVNEENQHHSTAMQTVFSFLKSVAEWCWRESCPCNSVEQQPHHPVLSVLFVCVFVFIFGHNFQDRQLFLAINHETWTANHCKQSTKSDDRSDNHLTTHVCAGQLLRASQMVTKKEFDDSLPLQLLKWDQHRRVLHHTTTPIFQFAHQQAIEQDGFRAVLTPRSCQVRPTFCNVPSESSTAVSEGSFNAFNKKAVQWPRFSNLICKHSSDKATRSISGCW